MFDRLAKVAVDIQPLSFLDRLDYVSHHLLDTPYQLTQLPPCYCFSADEKPTLKEAIAALDKQLSCHDYHYESTGVDCVSYVEVVCAMASMSQLDKHKDFNQAIHHHIQQLRYQNGIVHFCHRNHFFELDWVSNNHGLVAYMNEQLGCELSHATCLVDQPEWFSKNSVVLQLLPYLNDKDVPYFIQRAKIYTQLKPYGFGLVPSILPYVSMTELIAVHDRLADVLPPISLALVVRPNWDKVEELGTHLNLSHLGFVVNKNNVLIFRHATSIGNQCVEEVLLRDYIQKYAQSPTVAGLSFLRFTEGT